MSELIETRALSDPWIVLVAVVFATFVAAYLGSLVSLRMLKPAAGKLPSEINLHLHGLLEKYLFPLLFVGALLLVLDAIPLPSQVLRLSHVFILLAAILLVVFFAAKSTSLVLASFATRFESLRSLREPVEIITKVSIIVLGGLIALDNLGVSITPLITTLGVGSLAVAIALQDTLSNLFAGFYIRADCPVQVGHYVRLQTGEEGYIEQIGWRNTRLRTLPSNIVIVPNSKIIQSNITNFNLPRKDLAVLVDVRAHYDCDLEKVEAIACAVAKEVLMQVPGGVATFEPFIRYHTYAESTIDFTVIMRGEEFTDTFLIKHEFIKRLHSRCQKEGIEIPAVVPMVCPSVRREDHENGLRFKRVAKRRKRNPAELQDTLLDKKTTATLMPERTMSD